MAVPAHASWDAVGRRLRDAAPEAFGPDGPANLVDGQWSDLPAADWAVSEDEGRGFADAIGAMFATVSARDPEPRALARLRAQMIVWSLAFLLKLDRDGRGPTHVWEPVRWDWVDRPLTTTARDTDPEGGVSSCGAASVSKMGGSDDT